MARGVMADKGEKVASPTSEPNDTKTQTAVPDPLTSHQPASATSCSCTKISTMQLFYEMKQKYPTVPDNVVCEFVGQNCHNRSACIDGLEDYPNSANVYPQALRNQSTKKKPPPPQPQQMNNKPTVTATKTTVADATKENDKSVANGVPLKPPNTLYLTNLNYFTRPINRPTRQAPPPPIAAVNSPHQQQKSLINQQPLNLSVNLIVSPVSQPPPTSSTSTSSQQQQSLPHYSFTLHQPSGNKTHPDNEQSTTIGTTGTTTDNLDGPRLRFMSSAYDAEIGYQSRLEVTVAGPNQPSVAGSYEFLKETETVNHQVLCKQKLLLELEKDRKRLERMQRELQAIQAPVPAGGIHALNLDVDKLRNDCKLMASLVEEAGPSYALGETNEAFYRNIYTGQQLPLQQRQPLRPHRPAPAPYQQNRPKNQTNITGTDPRFISTPTITQSPLNSQYSESNEVDTGGWTCDLCTFQNKYTERTCEACTMPFLSAGNNQMGYNNGTFVQPSPPYPLTHYMPMPMPMHSMPYNNNNNINNMPYLYYQPTSMSPMPPQSIYSTPALPDPQFMHSRF